MPSQGGRHGRFLTFLFFVLYKKKDDALGGEHFCHKSDPAPPLVVTLILANPAPM